MTKKFDDFQSALEELCRAHGIQLGPEDDFSIIAEDLTDCAEPIYVRLIDGTEYARSPILALYNSDELSDMAKSDIKKRMDALIYLSDK